MAEADKFLSSYNGVQRLNSIESKSEEELVADLAEWQYQKDVPNRSERSVHEIDFIIYSHSQELQRRQADVAAMISALDVLDTELPPIFMLDSAE